MLVRERTANDVIKHGVYHNDWADPITVRTHDNKNTFGIVISWFDSDVYSSASASLMINGEVCKLDARSIFLIDNG